MTQLTDPTPTAAPAQLTVHYELTKSDFVETVLYIQGKSDSIRKQRRRGFLIMFVLGTYIALMLLVSYGVEFTGEILIWLSCFLVVFLFLFRRSHRKQMNRLIEPEGFESTLAPTTLTLDAEGVTVENDFHFTRLKWLAITQVRENPDYLFFYTNPLTAHAVPKRAFPTPADADAFYAFARRYCPQNSHCPKCQYSLRGNPGPQCPECGTSI